MKAIIKPSKLAGKIVVPLSKSLLQRWMICRYLSGNHFHVEDGCDDVLTMQECLYSIDNGLPIDCEDSGATLRFLVPLVLALKKESTFIGNDSLKKRPFSEFLNVLENKGAKLSSYSLPFSVSGSLVSGEYIIDASVSSQYVSGLLFALPLLDGDSSIVLTNGSVSNGYIEMTIDMISKFGIKVEKHNNTYFVKGNQKYVDADVDIEGDWSSGAIFYVLNAMGHKIDILGLKDNSLQRDIQIKTIINSNMTCSFENCIDLAPIVVSYLASINKEFQITGIRNLKYKESNRIEEISRLLNTLGFETKYSENGFGTLYAVKKQAENRIMSSEDHRILMAAVVSYLKDGGIVEGIENVSKSYPNFVSDLVQLGANIEVVK